MCGFSACISLPGAPGIAHDACEANLNGHSEDGNSTDHVASDLASKLQASINAIAHRGPDDTGIWISDDENVGLAHCRLSINDLSPAGRQPLHSPDGQVHAVVNGEIYDYDRLREECETKHGYQFQSDSDSELVVALYVIHNAPDFLDHLRGEFAFILYDNRLGPQRCIIARDRFGIKPLVYTKVGSKLLAASEAKAFAPLGWKPRWDVRAISDAGWMFDDRTLFRGVRKVLPGHYLDITELGGVKQVKYWDAEYEDKNKIEVRSVDEMIAGVRQKLVESVRLRLRADVPVGIYLSGGIDSSAIAGIVTELARKENVKIGNELATRVTCFSVAFPESSGYDESSLAERTAEWLNVKVIKTAITEATLAQDFADAVFHCEHHHFDLNFVAKFRLSALPRDHRVKVVLTGEGADEHFAGYPYFPASLLREADCALPELPLSQDDALRSEMHKAVEQEMRGIWKKAGAVIHGGGHRAKASIAGGVAADMSENLLAWHPTASLFSPWVQSEHNSYDCRSTVLNSHSNDVQVKMRSRWHPLHTAMYMWNKSSLSNVLLSCLGDRTEMAHSIEARTPFLDHHLADYVNRLPPSLKLNYGAETPSGELGPIWTKSSMALQSLTEKWILREAVRPYITDELYRRKKHPFLAPTRWSKGGPLHTMFQGLLTRDAVESLGFVDYAVVEDAMEKAWGEEAAPEAFRLLVNCGAWVTLGQRLGVAEAEVCDYEV